MREEVILHAFVVFGLVAWLAGLGAVVAGIALLIAGLALVLGECLSLLGGVRVSAQAFYATAGVLELAAATAILREEDVGILTPGAVAGGIVAAHIPRFQAALRRRRHD
jgi:hypothetical protein